MARYPNTPIKLRIIAIIIIVGLLIELNYKINNKKINNKPIPNALNKKA
jgi:hypothetical protein